MEADGAEVAVPRRYVQDGRIVLNVAPRAVQNLDLGNERIAFEARFSGRRFDVNVPVRSVLAVYAKENGRGIALAEEEATAPPDAPPPDKPPPDKPPPKGRPRLRVVS